MPLITVHNQFTRNDLGRLFAGRQYDETFGRNYSNLTPTQVDACMRRVQNGKWLPFVVKCMGQIVAWHYLHDMKAKRGSTWVSGYLMEGDDGPRGYGRLATMEKTLLWAYAQQYINRRFGFPDIFAYCMDVNTEGKRWAIDCCKLTVVGTMRHAVPEEDGWADIEVYTQVPAGAEECRRQATTMFPQGEGEWME